MRQLIIYLIVAPILVMSTVLYFWFNQPEKKSHYWWDPERETFIMFSVNQRHHKGSIEIRSKGKDFFKVGHPFKGQWLIWNNSFFEKKVRVHIWIYDERYRAWIEHTLKDSELVITLAPMEKRLVDVIGYLDPEVMWYERWVYANDVGYDILPNARSVTLSLVISDPAKDRPDLTAIQKKAREKGTVGPGDPDPVTTPTPGGGMGYNGGL
jgi:hypothetical protein